MLHSIAKGGAKEVGGISVQPSSHKGDVFAVGTSDEDVLRIFDVRSSTTGIYNPYYSIIHLALYFS